MTDDQEFIERLKCLADDLTCHPVANSDIDTVERAGEMLREAGVRMVRLAAALPQPAAERRCLQGDCHYYMQIRPSSCCCSKEGA